MANKYSQEEIDNFTFDLLNQIINSSNLKNKITLIRTGGQTGFDEAGAKASSKLGLNTLVLSPKYWVFRDKNGIDILNEFEFKNRFNITTNLNVNINKININSITELDTNLEQFNTLSLCDKIRLVMSDAKILNYINNPRFKNSHLLNCITIQNSLERIEKFGYENIEYTNNDSNQNMQTFSMLDMYHNSNPYLQSIAEDLVKYTFFNSGFKYGNNLAKIIPVELYYYTPDDMKIINEYNTKVYNNEEITPEEQLAFEKLAYSSKLYADYITSRLDTYNSDIMENLRDDMINNQIRYFHQQSLFNNDVNPMVWTNKKANNKYSTKFELHELKGNDIVPKLGFDNKYDIFIELAETIDKSKFARNKYIKYLHKTKNNDGVETSKLRLYTRTRETIQQTNGKVDVYVYYPINATLPGEVGTTQIDKFKEIQEDEYLNFIDLLKTTNKINSLFNGTFVSNEDYINKVSELYEMTNTSDYLKNVLPNLPFEVDEDGIIQNYNEVIEGLQDGNIIKSKIEDSIKQLGYYKENHGAEDITIYDEIVNGEFKNPNKALHFEFAKADNKTIHVNDEKNSTMYYYNSETNKLDLFDNGSPMSYDIKDILYYVVTKFNNEGQLGRTSDGRISRVRAEKVIALINSINDDRGEQSIVDYLKDNIKKYRTSGLEHIVDKVLELGQTEFFNDINNFRSKANTSFIKYSKNLTTISQYSTNADAANTINIISDLTLNIGSINSIEYQGIKDKEKVLVIDYNKTLDENLNALRPLLKSVNNEYITIGIIGETDDKFQEFYNEYTHLLLGHINNMTNKKTRVVTLDKPGIYQAALHSDNDVLILDNRNKFEKKHNDNIRYSTALIEEALTENQKSTIEDIKEINYNSVPIQTMQSFIEGGNNVTRIAPGVWKEGGNLKQSFVVIGNKLIAHQLLDKMVKHFDIKSALLTSKELKINLIESKNFVETFNSTIPDIDFNTLFNTENNETRLNIIKKIQTIGELRKGLNYINNLVETEIEDNNPNKSNLQEINDNIKHLKETKQDFDNAYNKTKTFVDNYFAHVIYEYSKNPNYTTKFNTLKEKLQAMIHGDGYIGKELTTEDIINITTQMYNSNEDISFVMKLFDSPFNTGITLIDSSLLEYFVQFESVVTKRKGYKEDLTKLYADLYGDAIKEMSKSNYDKRAKDSTKYVNEANEIISDTKWSDFHKSYYDNQREVMDLQRQYNNLDSKDADDKIKQREISQQIKNTWGKWLNTHVDGVNVVFDVDGNVSEINFNDSVKLDESIQQDIDSKRDFYKENGRFGRWLMVNKLHKLNSKQSKIAETDYIKLIPKQNLYKNKSWDALTEKEKTFANGLRTLINKINNENINEYDFDTNFFPKILEPSTLSAWNDIIGNTNITKEEDTTKVGVNNETRFIIEAQHIKDFEWYNEFNIPNKAYSETKEEHDTRSLIAVNNWYKTVKGDKKAFINEKIGDGFKTLDDVYKYNRYVREYNAARTARETIKDPVMVLKTYIDSMTNYKFMNDFYSYNLALINTLNESMNLTSSKGLQDYLGSKRSGERENIPINFSNSNANAVLNTLNKNITGVSRVNNMTDKVVNMLYRYTSTTFMAGGFMNGIKNVLTGYNQIITEAVAHQFITPNDLKNATAEYISLIPQLLSETGDEQSKSLIIALMKSAPEIYEDTSEMEYLKAFPNLAGKIKWAYDASYLCNNAGEHFMQYSMFLANLKSHKVFEGKVFSRFDFIDGNARRGIESLLTEQEKISLDKYIIDAKKKQKHEIEEHSHLTDWMWQHKTQLKDRHSQILNKIETLNKESIKTYESLPSVESQFELINGVATLKPNTISQNEYALFKRKCQIINQYMQGVYNRIDKNAIRQTTWGMGLMQFRNWMRPNIARMYGTKLNRSVFNEGLGIYQKGAYSTLFNLLWTPIRNRKYKNDEGEYIKKGFANLMLDYLNYFSSIKFQYKTMDENSKAKVKMAITNFSQIAGLTLTTALILGLSGDDDEEQREAINNSKLLAATLYFTYSVNSELNQMLPTQLFSTLKKMKQNIAATENVAGDIITLIKTGVTYPFEPESETTYDRGIYKGEDKLKIEFEKVFPIARQVNKVQYIESYMNWYKQYALRWY
jgi:hypothetical protein